MKKTSIVIMVAVFISITQLMGQTIPEGINHLYSERNQSAKAVFDKLIGANPNNLDAIYWLGQTYIANNDVNSARDLYDKALTTNGNAPLILVGRGHVDLIDNKTNDARQRFEAAITASKSKKGDDPNVLNAIGRANINAKTGDIAYAIEKLKIAADRDPKNPDIFLNLGDAYRKTHDGGLAVTNYDKAIAVSPTFARAEFRKAKIYETQKNWEVYLDDLNKTLAMDPKFAPAYYELYYYNLYRQKFAEADDFAKKYIANTDADVQTDYLRAQTLWAKKDFDDAIGILKNIVAKAGDKTKPQTYKLLAYSYTDKGDTASAKEFIDQYFAKATDEDLSPPDYILKGKIYGAVAKDDNLVLDSYKKAISLDTVYESKMKTLQDAVDLYKSKGNKKMEAELRLISYQTKRNPNPAEVFSIGIPLYQSGDYQKADSLFSIYVNAAPDSLYGHYWSGLTNLALDTTMSVEPYLSKMVEGFKKTLEIGAVNKDKFKSQGVRSSIYLAGIYNNTKKDRDSAIYFVDKGLEFDPASQNLLGLKQALLKKPAPARNGTPAKANGASKPTAFNKQESDERSGLAAKK